MSTDSGYKETVTDRFELYLALDAEGLYEELGDDPLDEVHPPGYGLAYTEVFQEGINSFTDRTRPFAHFVMTEPGHEDKAFCFHQAVEQLEDHSEWFENESLYNRDERSELQVYAQDDIVDDVSLKESGGVTVVLQYDTNRYTADDHMLRAQLFYGGPWCDPSEQQLAVTIETEHMTGELEEVFGVIERLFRWNPVDDISLCIYDDDDSDRDLTDSDSKSATGSIDSEVRESV